MAITGQLEALFSPRSIAIIGASADRNKLSGLPLFFLRRHGYQGRVFPINPRAGGMEGVRCYPNLAAVAEPIDLALILLPAEHVLTSVDECIAAGIRVAIVFASGFAEGGDAGRRLQEALVARIAGTSLRLLGPNCMGVINPHEGVAGSFSQALLVERLLPGRLAFLGQSGAIGGSVLDMCQSRGIGLSRWLSTGNQADLDVIACARFLLDDPHTDVLALYLEGLSNANAYVELAREALSRGKPLLVLKSGHSAAGIRAAASHTGSVAGNGAVFAAVSRQQGVLLVNDVEEMLDAAEALLTGRVAGGRSVGVVSSSGGVGVLLADAADRMGLALAPLQAQTRERLQAVVPAYGSVLNPVDATAALVARMMGGEPGLWQSCYGAVADDPGVDQLVVGLTMVTGQAGVTLAKEVIAATADTEKPVLVTWLGADLCRDAHALLRSACVPLYHSSARAMRVAALMADWGRQRKLRPGTAPTVPVELRRAVAALPTVGGALMESECQPLLRAAGIGTPRSELVKSPSEAEAAARRLGRAVVMKVQSPDILHKTEVGGVRVGIGASEAAEVFRELVENLRQHRPEARLQGVLVQQLAPAGLEVLAGVTRDPQFGPIMAFGMGGTMVEALGDVTLRLLPLGVGEAEAMIREVRAARLLQGFRGRPALDQRALARTLMQLSTLQATLGDRLLDLEINPLLVCEDGMGVCALDCVLRLAPAATEQGDA